MSVPSLYSDGYITVTNGSTAFTGSGTAWSSQLKRGTVIRVGTASCEVASIEDDTHGTFYPAGGWPGDTAAGAAYVAVTGNDGAEIAEYVRTLMERWIAKGGGRTSAGSPVAANFDNNDHIYVRDSNYLAVKDQGVIKAVSAALSAFGTVVFGDVTTTPSERDQYDDGQGPLASAPNQLLFFSRTEGGFYQLIDPDTGSGATWSDLIVIKGPTVAEVLAELGISSITISTDDPSGGSDGDLWFKVGA